MQLFHLTLLISLLSTTTLAACTKHNNDNIVKRAANSAGVAANIAALSKGHQDYTATIGTTAPAAAQPTWEAKAGDSKAGGSKGTSTNSGSGAAPTMAAKLMGGVGVVVLPFLL